MMKSFTTISAATDTREKLKRIADRMGVSQRKCLDILIDEKIHRDKLSRGNARKEFERLDIPDALNQINRRLERMEERGNLKHAIAALWKGMEASLKPMNLKTEAISAKLQVIIDALNKIPSR